MPSPFDDSHPFARKNLTASSVNSSSCWSSTAPQHHPTHSLLSTHLAATTTSHPASIGSNHPQEGGVSFTAMSNDPIFQPGASPSVFADFHAGIPTKGYYSTSLAGSFRTNGNNSNVHHTLHNNNFLASAVKKPYDNNFFLTPLKEEERRKPTFINSMFKDSPNFNGNNMCRRLNFDDDFEEIGENGFMPGHGIFEEKKGVFSNYSLGYFMLPHNLTSTSFLQQQHHTQPTASTPNSASSNIIQTQQQTTTTSSHQVFDAFNTASASALDFQKESPIKNNQQPVNVSSLPAVAIPHTETAVELELDLPMGLVNNEEQEEEEEEEEDEEEEEEEKDENLMEEDQSKLELVKEVQLHSSPSHHHHHSSSDHSSGIESIHPKQEFNTTNHNDTVNSSSASPAPPVSQSQAAAGVSSSSQQESTNIASSNGGASKKQKVCNCKRTKCLKLYCDCFAAGEICGIECNCYGCHNNSISEQRADAIFSIIDRQPDAFGPKVQSNTHKKGCHCTRSGCLKKYCECYTLGVNCGEYCKCICCKNVDLNHTDRLTLLNNSTKQVLQVLENSGKKKQCPSYASQQSDSIEEVLSPDDGVSPQDEEKAGGATQPSDQSIQKKKKKKNPSRSVKNPPKEAPISSAESEEAVAEQIPEFIHLGMEETDCHAAITTAGTSKKQQKNESKQAKKLSINKTKTAVEEQSSPLLGQSSNESDKQQQSSSPSSFVTPQKCLLSLKRGQEGTTAERHLRSTSSQATATSATDIDSDIHKQQNQQQNAQLPILSDDVLEYPEPTLTLPAAAATKKPANVSRRSAAAAAAKLKKKNTAVIEETDISSIHLS